MIAFCRAGEDEDPDYYTPKDKGHDRKPQFGTKVCKIPVPEDVSDEDENATDCNRKGTVDLGRAKPGRGSYNARFKALDCGQYPGISADDFKKQIAKEDAEARKGQYCTVPKGPKTCKRVSESYDHLNSCWWACNDVRLCLSPVKEVTLIKDCEIE